MENFDFDKNKDIKDIKDILDAIKKMRALQEQINNPTRSGMTSALSDAQSIAREEILQVEYSQGDTVPTPWACIPYEDLYRKLSQYQEGLRQYCIKKVGEKAFKELQENTSRKSKWEKVKPIISFALDKGADVAIAILSLVLQMKLGV